jgi:Cu/Ag efflux protein CusF
MWRKFRILSVFVVMLGMIAGPAWVRAQQSMPGPMSTQTEASLEGTVKKVNSATSSVEVSIGQFGLWAKTLEVSHDTEIRVEGRKASLEDLHEGEKVKASYETRVGKSFATSIEVMPMPEPGKAPGHAGPTTQ